MRNSTSASGREGEPSAHPSADPGEARIGRSRQPVLRTCCLFGLLIVVLYADPLLRRRNFDGRDLLAYNLPIEKAVHDAYRRGRLPVWFSEISGGRPLLANPNAGALYPVRPLLALLPFPLAFRIFPVLHWILAGVGMIVWMRGVGATAAAGWIAAITYVFSGVGVSEVFYSNYQPGMALLPWILWGVSARFSTRALRWLALSFLWALILLAGDVFSILIAGIGAAAWIRGECRSGDRAWRVGVLAGSLVLGALLALPQWVAAALWAPLTERGVVGFRLSETLTFSVSAWRLLELVVPYPFGETWSLDAARIWAHAAFRDYFGTLYCGILPLLGLFLLKPRRVAGIAFARALALTCFLLAWLPSLVPAAARNAASPIPLRYPEKFVVGMALAMAFAAGAAWDAAWAAGAARWLRPLLWGGAALAAAACAAAVRPAETGHLAGAVVRAPVSSSAEAGRQVAVALAEGGLLWMLSLLGLAGLGRQRAGGSLLALSLVPILAGRRLAVTSPQEAMLAPTRMARVVARRDPQRLFRTVDESRYVPPSSSEGATLPPDPTRSAYLRRHAYLYTQALWGEATVFNSDLDAGDLSRVESLRKLTSFLARQDAGRILFQSLSLRYGVRAPDQERLPGFLPRETDAAQARDEDPQAWPAIRILESWREVPGSVEALAAVSRLRPGEVVIETGRSRSGGSAGGALRVLEDSPERLRVLSRSSTAVWLFVLRGYWPFRTVRIDGRDAEVFPATLAFSAVALPAGSHRVDWQERVPGSEASWLGPALFAAAAFGLYVLHRRTRVREAAGGL